MQPVKIIYFRNWEKKIKEGRVQGLDKIGNTLYALLIYGGRGEITRNGGLASLGTVCLPNDYKEYRTSGNRYFTSRDDLFTALVSHGQNLIIHTYH